MDLLDHLLIFLDDYLAFVKGQFATRTFAMWFLFFFPLVVFFELPRYAVPLIVLPVLKLLGRLRDDTEQKEAFLQTVPRVSVVIAARNEESIIGQTIESLLSVEYDALEIIVVDDSSTDRTYEVAQPYADRGLIKLFRNAGRTGRAGRPIASNFGLRMATGEFIVSVDADTTFDRDMLLHIIGPFHDPKVGVVAGNLKVRNRDQSVWTALQATEYLISIGLWKQWSDVKGTTLQASGAYGAFRREVLADVGAWSAELAEDADVSLKAKKLGWKVVFAPRAIAMTTVPADLMGLVRQRVRWDRGFLRTYYHKHGDLLRFWRFRLPVAWELAIEYLMIVLFNLIFPVYFVLMAVFAFKLLTFVLLVCYAFYAVLTFLALVVALWCSERARTEWPLAQYAALFPLYKGLLRWVRTYALVMELFRLRYRDPYLPDSAYKNAEIW